MAMLVRKDRETVRDRCNFLGHTLPPLKRPLAIRFDHRIEKAMHFTAVFRQIPEGFVAFVEELPGANTQAQTLDEARANLVEAVELVLEANRTLAEESIQGQNVIREPFDITAQ